MISTIPSSAIVGLLGVMLGAILTAWFTRRQEQKRFYRDSQRQAYSLFLSSLSGLATFPSDSPAYIEARKGLIEARCQIALYGSPQAIRILAGIFERYSDFQSILAQAHLSDLITQMRYDSGGRHERGLRVELASLVISTVSSEKSE
jgi:hypothetical protein